jgi:hypothetical protein
MPCCKTNTTIFCFCKLTCHVATHKGCRLQSNTCHVANKYNHFVFCKLTDEIWHTFFFSRCYHTMVQSNITSCCKQTCLFTSCDQTCNFFIFFTRKHTHAMLQTTKEPCCNLTHAMLQTKYKPFFLQSDTPCCKLQRNQVAITRLFMLQTHSIPAVVAT